MSSPDSVVEFEQSQPAARSLARHSAQAIRTTHTTQIARPPGTIAEGLEQRPIPGGSSTHSSLSPPDGTVDLSEIVRAVSGARRVGAESARYRRAKRMLDVALATFGLVVASPLIAVLALLVRLDSAGPVFFRQHRVAEGGRIFTILKLRTMREPDPSNSLVAPTALPEPERITRVGRYLRRWSLDELPQLVNVLRGDMSLVGPRPERPEIVLSRYADWQFQRFLVPQGMTGWWQITGRGRSVLYDGTDDDLYYLSRASFLFDLKILLLTLPAVVRQAGVL